MGALLVTLPERSNRESWQDLIALNDIDTGEPLALADGGGVPLFNFELRVSRQGTVDRPWLIDSYYDLRDRSGAQLIATLGAGLTIVQAGILRFAFTPQQMGALGQGLWCATLLMSTTDGLQATELYRASLPIRCG